MDKRAQRVEELLERSMDSVTSHPAFLNAVSTMLNVNSYRKIWFRKSMEAIWRDLELPVRREQEKMMNQIEELNVRIKKLEMDLEIERKKATHSVAAVEKAQKVKNHSAAAVELEFQ